MKSDAGILAGDLQEQVGGGRAAATKSLPDAEGPLEIAGVNGGAGVFRAALRELRRQLRIEGQGGVKFSALQQLAGLLKILH